MKDIPLAHRRHGRLRLDVIGDGPLIRRARSYVADHGLGDVVHLHGPQRHERVLAMMRRADVFVYHAITSPEDGDAEGLPNVILEAMTVGLPVVATRHAGIPEVVCKRASGLLTEEGDVTSMADALSMFAASPDMRIRMGRQGWQRAREHFSREAYRAALLSLLGLAGHAGVVSA